MANGENYVILSFIGSPEKQISKGILKEKINGRLFVLIEYLNYCPNLKNYIGRKFKFTTIS